MDKETLEAFKSIVKEAIKEETKEIEAAMKSQLEDVTGVIRDVAHRAYPARQAGSPRGFDTGYPAAGGADRRPFALAALPFSGGIIAIKHSSRSNGHDTRAVQHYLGHKNITNTVRYTELAAGRFSDFWKD